jgi:hypothetical protein
VSRYPLPPARRVERDVRPAVAYGGAPMRPMPTGPSRAVPKVQVPFVPTAPTPRSSDPTPRRRWLTR